MGGDAERAGCGGGEPGADLAGAFVFGADLGQDRIYSWRLDRQAGKLVANTPAFVAVPPGDGPRHFAFHPSGRWFYSLQEEGSTLVTFDYDDTKGRLTARQTLSSLPPGVAGTNSSDRPMCSPHSWRRRASSEVPDRCMPAMQTGVPFTG